MAKTVVFDFDGVIHSYTSGWKGETNIPDPPVPGIQEALKEIHDAGYEVVVVSTRCKTVLGRMAIENWLDMYGMTQEVDKVCKEKPPAIAYIDDRAICFDGHPETLLKKIKNFQPWYKTPTLTPPNEPLPVLVNAETDREYIDYICPRCKEIISQRRRGQRMETVYQCKYHDNCGQCVDWSDPQPDHRPPEGET